MNELLHPKFKINGQTFTSRKDLMNYSEDLIGSNEKDQVSIGAFILEWLNDKDFIEVQTSGSTGNPKKINLLKEYVYNSASTTVQYFDLFENTKALLCLPAEYIAGKMMLVRAMIAGWDIYPVAPGKNPLENNENYYDFAAMVPYQVFHSFSQLNQIKKLIIGGGAVPPALEEKLQQVETAVFATYGMTETISHVAVRSLNGNEKSSVFNAMAYIDFSQTKQDCLKINAPKISSEIVETRDIVELISPTSFKFLGRLDNIINTGGVKVYPESIEEKLSQVISHNFFIASEKDDALGEKVILVVEGDSSAIPDFSNQFTTLTKYERPKKIYVLPEFIYTETGKIKREENLNIVLNKN